ncbi:MAG TPA: hypothetical protein ENH82_20445 [bacterium]|nr:hypothetical protein [bacterium]
MKVAYHFIADHGSLGGYYGFPIEKRFFEILLSKKNLEVSSKVFHGDLLIHTFARNREDTESGHIERFNKEKYIELLDRWINQAFQGWNHLSKDFLKKVANKNIHVICLENVTHELAEFIANKLDEFEPFLGAFEVNDASKIHWVLYSSSLVPAYRLINRNLYFLWDGLLEDNKDTGLANEYKKLDFISVEFESLNGRFTIFDKYHGDFKYSKRVSEWKIKCGDLLAFIADDVVNRLSDIAPKLGDKLWAAFNAYDTAETNENYTHVAVTCRRIVEYVTDCIFPPTNELYNGHKLGEGKFRNRLWAYADEEKRSDTNIDVITISNKVLDEQFEKLNKLTNKGIHSEIFRSEARRCLLRTMMLLDDIISLKANAFDMKPELDIDMIKHMIDGRDKERL